MHQTGTFVSTFVFAEIIMVDYWGPLSENHGEKHNKDLGSKHDDLPGFVDHTDLLTGTTNNFYLLQKAS